MCVCVLGVGAVEFTLNVNYVQGGTSGFIGRTTPSYKSMYLTDSSLAIFLQDA